MSDKLIIYGAGKYGKALYTFLKERGIRVEAFCQTQILEHNAKVEDVRIISIEELKNLEGKITLLIAMADAKVSDSIKVKLNNLFLDRITVLECGKFIEQNIGVFWGEHYCLICGSAIAEFDADGIKSKIFEEHHIIGGGYRENCRCPICGCIDRNRWLLHVLSKHTYIFEERCTVLHFAPEEVVQKSFFNNEQCDYYTCDILPGRAMHVVDATDIQFKDETFDYIIINHVLEHIVDEEKAVSELKRVLKSGGKLILSFPICTDQKTIQDDNIKTEAERLELYGQEDHVRLYGYDYKEHLESYGLKITVYSPKDEYNEQEIQKYAFIQDDVLMICEK